MLESGTNGVKIGFAVSGKTNPHGSLYNPKDATKPLSSARLYTSLFVRHWDSYIEPQKNAIWYGLLQIRPSASGLRQRYSLSGLTNLMAVSGLEGVESPIPPFGGADHFDISQLSSSRRTRTLIRPLTRLAAATTVRCSHGKRWASERRRPVDYQPCRVP